MSNRPFPTLRRALWANVIYSSLTGALLVTDAGQVSAHLGVAPFWTQATGLSLWLFAGLVALLARRPTAPAALLVSLADLLWVAGFFLACLLWPSVTPWVGGSALGVLGVALAQLRGLHIDRLGGQPVPLAQ